jgi:hypothetical protein
MLTPVVTEITEGTAHLSEGHEPSLPLVTNSDISDSDETGGPEAVEV